MIRQTLKSLISNSGNQAVIASVNRHPGHSEKTSLRWYEIADQKMEDGVAAHLIVGHEMQKARAGEIDPRDDSNFVRVNLLNAQSTVKAIAGNAQPTEQGDTEEVEESNAEPGLPTSSGNEKPANDSDGSE